MSKSQLDGLRDCPLHRNTPFGMTNVSMTQLSIARFYGGINYNGEHYIYLPETDELIRKDVFKWKQDQDKKTRRREPPSASELWDSSPGSSE